MTTADLNAYELAHLAGVSSPDSLESPGAKWLKLVASCLDEITSEDGTFEAADSVVPVYTHERWTIFVDLCAYDEDLSDYGGESQDMTTQAGIALLMIAERLLVALIDGTEWGADES